MLPSCVEITSFGLVECGISIAQLDAYPPLSFFGVGIRPSPRKSLRKGSLAMVHMSDHADIDFRLTR